MKHHPGLRTPYTGLNRDTELSRLSADIAFIDKHLIKTVCPVNGLLMQMTQLFFASVCHELRTKNITHYTPENESELINIIRRRTATLIDPKTIARDGGGGVEGAHEASTGTQLVLGHSPLEDQEGKSGAEGENNTSTEEEDRRQQVS